MAETTLRSKATPQACRQLARSAVRFLQQASADPDLLYDIELLITEACSNVIIHGYNWDANGEIEVHLVIEDHKRATLTFRDWGKPYSGPGGDAAEPHPQNESGRGQVIIARLSDAHAYAHDNGTNILRIEKALRS